MERSYRQHYLLRHMYVRDAIINQNYEWLEYACSNSHQYQHFGGPRVNFWRPEWQLDFYRFHLFKA